MQKFIDSDKPLKICAIFCGLCLLFIWGHSMMPFDASTAESDAVKALVLPEVEPTIDNLWWQSYVVRKSAHVIEFFGCGALVTIMTYLCFARFLFKKVADFVRWWWAIVLVSGAICFVISLLDEAIQLTIGRDGKISDVIIDIKAAGAAIIFVTIVLAICSAISVYRSKHASK